MELIEDSIDCLNKRKMAKQRMTQHFFCYGELRFKSTNPIYIQYAKSIIKNTTVNSIHYEVNGRSNFLIASHLQKFIMAHTYLYFKTLVFNLRERGSITSKKQGVHNTKKNFHSSV